MTRMPLTVWALAPLALLGPALTCGVPRVMAPLYMICTILAAVANAGTHKRLPRPDWTLLGLFAAIIAYGVASYGWTLSPENIASKAGQLAGVMVPAAFIVPILKNLTRDARNALGMMVIAGFLLGNFVYYSEIYTNFAIYDALRGGHSADVIDNKQNKAAVVLGLWGMLSAGFVLAGDYTHKGRLIAGIATLCIVILLNSESDSGTVIAMLAAPMALMLVCLPARTGLRLAVACITGLFAAMPIIGMAFKRTPSLLLNEHIPSSLRNRFEIWDQASRRILEHPVRGWGLDASRHMPNRGDTSVLYDQVSYLAHLHPHNGPLQIWFELGLPGVVFFMAFILLMFARIERMSSDNAMRYATFALSILFLVTLSIWGITQTWFMATLAGCGVLASTAANTSITRPAGQA